jgi:alanine dehydrogenase
MQIFGHKEISASLDWLRMIHGLEDLLRQGAEVPQRLNYSLPTSSGGHGSLLVMPAWIPGELIGVKLVTFFPDNGDVALPTISAAYVAFDGATGQLKGILDGEELTARRTAAASAVAAKRLARPDAAHLLVIGTGQLSAKMALAHASVRSLSRIEIFGRDPRKAEEVVKHLQCEGIEVLVSEDLEGSAQSADIVSCVTSATSPVLKGAWLKPGAHVDLVGGFRADMREADDEVVRRASIFVDVRRSAILAGDLAQPITAALLSESDIKADLSELVRGEHMGRTSPDEITLFKSVGDALEDLAAARLVVSPRPG